MEVSLSEFGRVSRPRCGSSGAKSSALADDATPAAAPWILRRWIEHRYRRITKDERAALRTDERPVEQAHDPAAMPADGDKLLDELVLGDREDRVVRLSAGLRLELSELLEDRARLLSPYRRPETRTRDEKSELGAVMKRKLRTCRKAVSTYITQLVDDGGSAALDPAERLFDDRMQSAIDVERVEVLDDSDISRAHLNGCASGRFKLTDETSTVGVARESTEQERRDRVMTNRRHLLRLAGRTAQPSVR